MVVYKCDTCETGAVTPGTADAHELDEPGHRMVAHIIADDQKLDGV